MAPSPSTRHSLTLNPWLPALILLLFLAIAAQYWLVAKHHDEYQTRIALTQTTSAVSRDFSLAVTRYVHAIERMAQRKAHYPGMSEADWRADARVMHSHYPHFQALEWVDTENRIQWIEPLAGNEAALGFDVGFNDERVRYLELAALEGRTDFLKMATLQQGGEGMVAYTPIGQSPRSDGFIAGVFRLDTLIGELMDPELQQDFAISIRESSNQIFTALPTGEPLLSSLRHQAPLAIEDLDWALQLQPTQAWVDQQADSWSLWILATLLVSGGALSTLLYLSQTVWRRKYELALTQRSLEEETDRRLNAQSDLECLATMDTLTGLANRRFFVEDLDHTLAQARQHHHQVALIVIDLNHFQTLNNSLGHRYGDALLKNVANRLDALSDEQTMISHSSGDEFLVHRYPISRLEQVFELLDDLIACFREPFILHDQSHYVTASMGVALFPENGNDADVLLRNADTALYRAKEKGGNSYAFFTARMHDQAAERMELHRHLHEAIQQHQFVLHFQPQMDLATGEIGSAEALIRWQHPERGLLMPDDFIPAAMDTGLICDIGRWVIAAACAQLHAWKGTPRQHWHIAINLSAEELRQPDLVSYISACLERNELDPGKLEIELTEQSLIDDVAHNQIQLTALSELGLAIALDDFGTGYSTLAYLRSFPITSIKIDRSFISRVTTSHNDAVITRALINLAHNLGIRIFAEGVENAAQLAFLRAHRCDFAQGYHIGYPLAADDLDCGQNQQIMEKY